MLIEETEVFRTAAFSERFSANPGEKRHILMKTMATAAAKPVEKYIRKRENALRRIIFPAKISPSNGAGSVTSRASAASVYAAKHWGQKLKCSENSSRSNSVVSSCINL